MLLLVKAEGSPRVLCGPGGVSSEKSRCTQSAAQVTQLPTLGAGLGLLQLTCHSRSRLECGVNPILCHRKCGFEATRISHDPSSFACLHTLQEVTRSRVKED